ncbi:MAG: response regulator [Proteobacteria bacterium]|nr:MAG: response regulator [Pseudomonadota bacterium]
MAKIVLVMEDETLTQTLVTSVITHCGLVAKIAKNGREGLDLLNNGLDPDLILLDLEMPVLDGMGVLAALRDLDQAERCPIIVFTANSTETTVLNAVNMGASDYVVKPFQTVELIARIKDLTFEVSEDQVRSLLQTMHFADRTLEEQVSLRKYLKPDISFYPVFAFEKSLCLSIPRGITPQAASRLSSEDLFMMIGVYRKTKFGWRKVWPRGPRHMKMIRGDGYS